MKPRRDVAIRKWGFARQRKEGGLRVVLQDFTGAGECPAGSTPGSTWVVVLAGGQGIRLQAFIRQCLGSDRPKQFCRIIGSRSMLRHTWDRAAQVVSPGRIVTIITAGQEPYLEEEWRHGAPGTVLVQPANKETAPGLLLPLLWIDRQDPEATVVVYPSDHFIWQEDRFTGDVRGALAAAAHLPDRLILLGVEADDPKPGYGWIAPAEPIQAAGGGELYAERRFWEKPNRPTAAQLSASGCFWNTLVLIGQLGAFLRLAARCIPEVLSPLRRIIPHVDTPTAAAALAGVYRRLRPTDLSRVILGRCPEALLLQPLRGVYWSDRGHPDRILRTLRRFDRRPTWLPVYAPASTRTATGPASI
ncbi:MAG TPA: sugar phosphate nucleotidyltransferase [Candidatus Methylomirabilis sp.]|nr:sugar phosphate nucleotidyltransferase [Candidatus Methylomirabilis sp.]